MMGVVSWVSPFIMDLDSFSAYLQRLSLDRRLAFNVSMGHSPVLDRRG
jgi:hypothetical protein